MSTQKHSITLLVLLLFAELSFADEFKPTASFVELPWRYVIGGHSGGKWLDSEAAGKRPTALRTTYHVFTLKGESGLVTVA